MVARPRLDRAKNSIRPSCNNAAHYIYTCSTTSTIICFLCCTSSFDRSPMHETRLDSYWQVEQEGGCRYVFLFYFSKAKTSITSKRRIQGKEGQGDSVLFRVAKNIKQLNVRWHQHTLTLKRLGFLYHFCPRASYPRYSANDARRTSVNPLPLPPEDTEEVHRPLSKGPCP